MWSPFCSLVLVIALGLSVGHWFDDEDDRAVYIAPPSEWARPEQHVFVFENPECPPASHDVLGLALQILTTATREERERVAIACNSTAGPPRVVHWAPVSHDRTCLVPPPSPPERPTPPAIFVGDLSDTTVLLRWVNEQANLFRGPDGSLTEAGLLLSHASANLYEVPAAPHAGAGNAAVASVTLCDRVPFSELTEARFFEQYLLRQRPVVVTGFPARALEQDGEEEEEEEEEGTSSPVLKALRPFLSLRVGTKLSPSVAFEGVEPLHLWGMADEQRVPPDVLAQLQSPDLVVVRAAHRDLPLEQVLELIARQHRLSAAVNASTRHSSRASLQQHPPLQQELNAYVEYLDLTGLPGLLDALIGPALPSWIGDVALEGKAHLWLGDGRTIGKLHFDPFDNLLVQLEGSKTFVLFDAARNERFYEGHMREAELTFIEDSETFTKHTLSETTSMVHSPVTIDEPDFETFPLARDALQHRMECTVDAGAALFVPSFWWHEVRSTPGPARSFRRGRGPENRLRVNVAVNFWFAPLFDKEFPCSTCRKTFNPKYRAVIEQWAEKHRAQNE